MRWKYYPVVFIFAFLFLGCKSTAVSPKVERPGARPDPISAVGERELVAPATPRKRERYPAFRALLDSVGLRYTPPFTGYEELRARGHELFPEQYVTGSRENKTELRFRVVAETEAQNQLPQIAATSLAMNLGSNDEDAVTAVHSFGEEALAVLNADWARMYTFRPKRSVSDYAQAQLISIYREGVGLAHTLILFDEAPDDVEARQLSLRFR